MSKQPATSQFETILLRPAKLEKDEVWSFLILPKEASDTLPRRGRATVEGTLNGQSFQATLDPDGKLSHWLKVGEELRKAAGAEIGEVVELEIRPVESEPEPDVPADFSEALAAHPEAKTTWDNTTTIARLDWIHWMSSAKQQKTREKRIRDACDMLGEGKKRVCCFDPSGFYSKSLSAPKSVE